MSININNHNNNVLLSVKIIYDVIIREHHPFKNLGNIITLIYLKNLLKNHASDIFFTIVANKKIHSSYIVLSWFSGV